MMRFFRILAFTTLVSGSVSLTYAQGTSVKELPKGWHLLDKSKDGFYGISLDKAYEFLKNKKSTPTIVAVIDSGIDTLHEDLKDVLWTNPKEIPGNGIDDDKNGYIDDVHGWNFLGGKDGRNVKDDSYEGARVYHKFKKEFGGAALDTANFDLAKREQYRMWLKAKMNIEGEASHGGIDVSVMQAALRRNLHADSVLQKAIGKAVYTGNELDKYAPASPEIAKSKGEFLYMLKANNMMEMSNKEFLDGFGDYVNGEVKKKDQANIAPPDLRAEIVKDNEADINDRFYGNNDIMAGTPFHGTHVSGIIAAKRANGKGIDGVADNVKIMMIRAVPDGDEHDKDIANAIRYAVDNGAKVVNMSFGKSFSPEKAWVDDAVKYADSKGVLLVHAAGNDAADVDSTDNFPNANLKNDTERAANWITVGASSDPLAEPGYKSLTASFSNYGKKEVDVFSPGTKIYSTIPGGTTYGNAQGTSMAAPVVAGVAALILSYYPALTPEQVKMIIEKSAVPITDKVKLPGSDEMVTFSDISTSGGILNAYEAVKLASATKADPAKKLPTSTLKNKKN